MRSTTITAIVLLAAAVSTNADTSSSSAFVKITKQQVSAALFGSDEEFGLLSQIREPSGFLSYGLTGEGGYLVSTCDTGAIHGIEFRGRIVANLGIGLCDEATATQLVNEAEQIMVYGTKREDGALGLLHNMGFGDSFRANVTTEGRDSFHIDILIPTIFVKTAVVVDTSTSSAMIFQFVDKSLCGASPYTKLCSDLPAGLEAVADSYFEMLEIDTDAP